MFLIKDNILEFVKIYHVLGYASLISHLDHLWASGQRKGLKCSACVSGGTVILSPLFGVCEKLHALSNWMIWRRNIYFCINASNFFVTILY